MKLDLLCDGNIMWYYRQLVDVHGCKPCARTWREAKVSLMMALRDADDKLLSYAH